MGASCEGGIETFVVGCFSLTLATNLAATIVFEAWGELSFSTRTEVSS